MPHQHETLRPELLKNFCYAHGLAALAPEDVDWALTHRSYAYETGAARDNERIEFLGDAVLSAIVSEYLYAQHPAATEGELSKLRAQIVSRATLGERAVALGLGELILLGRGERETGGARRKSTLGSALEALIGLLYLRLGFAAAREFVHAHILARLEAKELAEDYKSALQEWAQREYHLVPKYTRVAHTGPEHNKLFTVQVEVAGRVLAQAEGPRIKRAENEAARLAIQNLGIEFM
jgi:ribonuclease III